MSSWSPQEYASGCWMSEYQYYEGPGSTASGNEFTVHATLEAGAEKYFSGIQVLIGCRDAEELADLEIQNNPSSFGLRRRPEGFLDHDLECDKATNAFFIAQQKGYECTKRWQDGDPCATGALPLCTLVFEIVDKSNNTWKQLNLVLHPPQATQSQPLRILYNHVELCPPTSRSCFLSLIINHTLRGSLKPDNPSGIVCAYPTPIGILAHGVKILPPSATRQPFINFPSELLSMIFEEAVQDKFRYNWRATLISFALVCRAWRPALDHLFEDFGPYNPGLNGPDPLQLARTIELHSGLGNKIRVFDPSHFRRAVTYLDFAKAIVTILRHATMITKLHVCDTHRDLAQDFVRAICSSQDIKHFVINRRTIWSAQADCRYMLSIGDIILCLAHWPRLQTLTVHGFSSTNDVDGLPTPACLIKRLSLQRGTLQLPQLRVLTTASCSTLHEVILQQISGLTNQDLRTWLLEVGPALTSVSIQFTPLSRRTDDEEYALDVALPRMTNLCSLELEGDIASELILLRYIPHELVEPTSARTKRYTLTIDNMPAINIHGFVSALRVTEWTHITATSLVLQLENMGLREKARKIVQERNIFLMM